MTSGCTDSGMEMIWAELRVFKILHKSTLPDLCSEGFLNGVYVVGSGRWFRVEKTQ